MSMEREHARAVEVITRNLRNRWPNVSAEDKHVRTSFARALERLSGEVALGCCDPLGEALIEAEEAIQRSDPESAEKLLSEVIEEVHTFDLIRYGALQLAVEHLNLDMLRFLSVWRSPAEANLFYRALLHDANKAHDSELPANPASSLDTPITATSSCTLSDEEQITPQPDHEDGILQAVDNDCVMEEHAAPITVTSQTTQKHELRNKLRDLCQKLDEFDTKWAQKLDAFDTNWTQKLDAFDATCDKTVQALQKMEKSLGTKRKISAMARTESIKLNSGIERSTSGPSQKMPDDHMKYADESEFSDSDSEDTRAKELKKRRESIIVPPHRSRTYPIAENPKREFRDMMSFNEIKTQCRYLRERIYETRVVICPNHPEEYVEGEVVLQSCCNIFVTRTANWDHEALIEGHMKLADEHGEQSSRGGGTTRDCMHAQREMWHLQDVLRLYDELSPW